MLDLLYDAWDLTVELIFPVLCGLAVLVVVVGGLVWGLLALDRASCRQEGRALAVEHRYDFPAGCFYRIGERWVPSGAYIAPEKVER